MSDLSRTLVQLIDRATPTDGFHKTSLPEVDCIKSSKPKDWSKSHWRAAFVIVAQGFKEIELEANVYRYKEVHYIATAVDLPVSSRIMSASSDKPFLAIRITLDPLELNEVAAKMKFDRVETADMKSHGIFTGPADANQLEAAIRLARLFQGDDRGDVEVLGPIIIRELYYHFLKSPNGTAFRQFTSEGSKLHSISESIKRIKNDLSAKLDIEVMAKAAHMSRTSYFSAFKQVTAMSPIQYQKKFRLMEAKQLITMEGETAESAAFRVGYKSASQFSREYSRMFGNPPGQDIGRR